MYIMSADSQAVLN